LVFLGVIGVLFSPSKSIRAWSLSPLILLLIIAGWGEGYFTGLPLYRMAMPLLFLAIPPAALWVEHLLQVRGTRAAFMRAALVAYLILGGTTVVKTYANKGSARYKIMSPGVQELVTWIEEETPPDGRILFAGKTVHKYSAHVAALPLFTKREMMACDYYHFSPKEVEYDYPPRVFRKEGTEGVFAFMTLYNVTHVVTYRSNYIRYFENDPEHYELAKHIESEHIYVFRVKRASTPLTKGKGSVAATFNRIDLQLDGVHDEVAIPYNWEEGLSVEAPAELFPYKAHPHVTLIGVRPNGKTNVTVRYRSWL